AIYLPMIPEVAVAMLACARLGAIHNVVFGGFSAESVKERIEFSEAKTLITVDGARRKGKTAPIKEQVDEVIGDLVDTMVVVKRVAYTHAAVFDLKPSEDVYWCAADVGWVTGHSYIVYGPLANGTTSVMWEGAPDYPHKGIWWELIERYGVSILYCAPTAIRACIKWGAEWPEKHNLASLRLLGSVGEPINPKAWLWYHKVIGGERCPISEGQGLLVLTQPWPSMLRTLYREEERFVETYFKRFGPETYLVGDAARRDDDGYYWIIGRIDDVLNVSGHRMS